MKRFFASARRLRLFLIAAAALFAVSCSRHPRITVVNDSPDNLTSLVISGRGFSEALGSFAPGQRKTVEVAPSGDTSLALAFEANGSAHSPPADGYFEASGLYRVTARVQPDFSVKVESEIR